MPVHCQRHASHRSEIDAMRGGVNRAECPVTHCRMTRQHAAHLAALSKGTIGVQAGGVDMIYPAENTKLAEDMAQKGLRVSEMPIGQQPIARHFPARNRIIY